MSAENRPLPDGLTRAAGWELTVERTLPTTRDEVWGRLLAEWLPRWLDVESVPQMVGAPLRHRRGARGRMIGCHVGRRVRLRWTPADLDHETVFQVTLQEPLEPSAPGTVVEVHQERLLGAGERQGLLEHWTAELEALVAEYGRELSSRSALRG